MSNAFCCRPAKIVWLAAIVVAIAAISRAGPILVISNGLATSNPWGDAEYGWRFIVNTPVTVTKLGLWDEGNDGFFQPHDIAIFDAAGNLVTSTTLLAGADASLDSGFRMTSVASVNLTVGATYDIVANNMSVDQMRVDILNSYVWPRLTMATFPSITYIGGRFGLNTYGQPLTPPTWANDNVQAAFFGPTFESALDTGVLVPPAPPPLPPLPPPPPPPPPSPVPDNGMTAALIGIALAGLVALRCKFARSLRC